MPRQNLNSYLRKIDFLTLLPALLLIGIGLLSVFSATHNAEIFIKFQKQVFWVILGFLFLLLTVIAPARFFHYSAWLVYAVAIASLVLVLLLGRTIGGNAGWFGFGGFGIQPSEFAKVATVLALAHFLSQSGAVLATFGDMAKAIAIVALPWTLTILQPDFGTGIVYWAIFLPMIFWAGAEMILLVTLISPILVAVLAIVNIWIFLSASVFISFIFYFMKRNLGVALLFLVLNLSVGFGVEYFYDHLPEYQKERIAVFVDPARSPLAAGYNVIQSKVAIGSGGFSGKGYLHGSQTQLRFVPEQWTDFIFCVPAEEFGFLGASLILFLFSVLLLRGVVLARQIPSRFASLVIIGITSMFLIHTTVSIGMTLGLLPVIGIPLPFMSYGGSFFITSMISLGLIMHFYATRDSMN